jgi:hypothetical protein
LGGQSREQQHSSERLYQVRPSRNARQNEDFIASSWGQYDGVESIGKEVVVRTLIGS